MARLRPGVRRG